MDDDLCGRLIIDETVVLSSEDEGELKNGNDIVVSITAAEIKEELLSEDTNTCSICNESFKYNIGLIYHMQMEHDKSKENPEKPENSTKSTKKRKPFKKTVTLSKKQNELAIDLDNDDNQRGIEILKKLQERGIINLTKVETSAKSKVDSNVRPMCATCKKIFPDKSKLMKHNELVLQFKCTFCNLKFCWESKYKKHLFKTHKLNAAVVCKQCSRVFSNMTELNFHSNECGQDVADLETRSPTI